MRSAPITEQSESLLAIDLVASALSIVTTDYISYNHMNSLLLSHDIFRIFIAGLKYILKVLFKGRNNFHILKLNKLKMKTYVQIYVRVEK